MIHNCDSSEIKKARIDHTAPLGKKGRGSKCQVWRRFLDIDANKRLASNLSILKEEFDLCKISTHIRAGGFEEEIAREALAFWKEKSIEDLTFQTVMEQAKAYTAKVYDPTEVQKEIFRLLRPSAGKYAKNIVAPTASGKTSGLAAGISAMMNGKQTEAKTFTVLSPISDTATEEFIAVMSAAGIPFCIGRHRDVKNPITKLMERKIQIIPSRETMGAVRGEHRPETIIQMSETMKTNKSRRHHTNPYPAIIICESSFREEGLVEVVDMAHALVAEYPDRYGDITVFVDDFGASSRDVARGKAVVHVAESAERIVTMTATPPSDFSSPERLINRQRVANGCLPFTTHVYTNTLGQGLDLVVEKDDGTTAPFTILDQDLSVFDTSPFALQTLSLSSTIYLLQRLIGVQQARDMILNMLPIVSLDALRKTVVENLKIMEATARHTLIAQAKAAHVVIPSSAKQQTLVLDEDPLQRAVYAGFTFDTGHTAAHGASSWLRNLEKYVATHTARIDKEDAAKEALKKKSLEDSMQDEAPSFTFDFPLLNKRLSYLTVQKFLEVGDVHKVSDEEMCIVLQKNVMVVTRTTPMPWIHSVSELSRPSIIFGDVRVMGIGIHMPDLNKVYLPRQYIPTELLIQAIGRAGRISQGVGTVYATMDQLLQAFDTSYGADITAALDALSAHLHEGEPVLRSRPRPRLTVVQTHVPPALPTVQVEVPVQVHTTVSVVEGSWEDEDSWDDEGSWDEDDESNLVGIPVAVAVDVAATVSSAPTLELPSELTLAVTPSEESSKEDREDKEDKEDKECKEDDEHIPGTRSDEAKARRRKNQRKKQKEKKKNKN